MQIVFCATQINESCRFVHKTLNLNYTKYFSELKVNFRQTSGLEQFSRKLCSK